MGSKERVVKEALSTFIEQHTAENVSLSTIDEIVLGYMISILEELGSDGASEDSFDVDQFTEMMAAYLPEFSQISSVDVCEWMFDLAAKLSNHESLDAVPITEPTKSSENGMHDPQLCNGQVDLENGKVKVPNINQTSPRKHHRRKKRNSSCSSNSSDQNSEEAQGPSLFGTQLSNSNETRDLSAEIKHLVEMFPSLTTVEVTHCLSVVDGDIEQAAQLLLHRQETGDSIGPLKDHQKSAKKTNMSAVDDKKVKDSIVAKYSFVEEGDEHKIHRPVFLANEEKKLIRYRDGQIVSKKGERFSEVKKDESEEMKKTYVNLKPAKKYRFH